MENNDYIFGIHAVSEAIKSGKEFEKVLIKKDSLGPQINELIKEFRNNGIPYQMVPGEKLNRITRKNHQGVIAYISGIEYKEIEFLLPQIFEQGKTPFFIILDHITDVRNIGAIARTAECAGVDAIIVPDKGSALINADAIKTSSGALHTVNMCRVKSLTNTIKYLKNSGITVYAATEKTESVYYEADMNIPVAIILGAEDTGISADCLKLCDKLIKIPISGQIKSLNVSVATGILIYEAVKQRTLITQ